MINTNDNRGSESEREIILLGLLDIDTVYGSDWHSNLDAIKKDIEHKAVKLNLAFKHLRIFEEKFEFLSLDDYNYVKNNYIYSAILVFNPNLINNNSTTANNKICTNSNIIKNSKDKEKNEDTVINANIINKEIKVENKSTEGHNIPNRNNNLSNKNNIENNYNTNNKIDEKETKNISENESENNVEKKKEGIGVLVITCKKIEKLRMKSILIKMLKNEIKVESTVLRKNFKPPTKYPLKTTELNTSKTKMTEIKYTDNPNETKPISGGENLFDVRRNNFFNTTALIYGSSNILANTSLVTKEYDENELAEKLKKAKKDKLLTEQIPKDNNVKVKKGHKIFKSFTSLFKK
ncbi:conserved protein, unknown function [Hepatocystis sp. ex Piliocolobus tephrosceles]|nr:conserved protein, unknown function [Hepatocystis sp. ex Piliocolobus tephrosceles]